MSNRPSVVDLLTNTLARARLRSSTISLLELGAPWGLRVECRARAAFFAVTRGNVRLEVGGHRPLALSAGDLVVLLRPTSYALRDSASSKLVTFDPHAHPSRVSLGGRRPGAAVIGGWLEAEESSSCRFVDGLPGVIRVSAEQRASIPGLAATIDLLSTECAGDAPGRQLVLARLAEVVFVQALRAGLSAADRPAHGWTHALTDTAVGLSLQHMYSSPERAWTVSKLARLAGQSRSAFAARFKAVIGEAPLEHLTRYRAEIAAELLTNEKMNVEEVAERVGYRAPAAFAKAFKRVVGEPPGAYRRRRRLDSSTGR